MTYKYAVKHGKWGKLHPIEECEYHKKDGKDKCPYDEERSEGGSVFCCSG